MPPPRSVSPASLVKTASSMALTMERRMSNVPNISPRSADKMSAVLETVQSVVQAELRQQRADGQPLKTAFDAVARALGVTPRRIRAYHYHEVAAEDVRATEWLAAMELRKRRRKRRVAEARAILAEEIE